MAEGCSFAGGCPIFKYFRASAKTVYLDMYCLGNFERCKRRRLRLAGQPVPENLLPHGGTLWDPNYRPASQR